MLAWPADNCPLLVVSLYRDTGYDDGSAGSCRPVTPLLIPLLVLVITMLVLETGALVVHLLLSLYRGEQCMTDNPAPLITAAPSTGY